MSDSTLTADAVGVFTRDQAEILSVRKTEPAWLREQRLAAQQHFAETPLPSTRAEDWRYTPIAELLSLEALRFADEASPVPADALPYDLHASLEVGRAAPGRLVQLDASVVLHELDEGLRAQGVILTSLDQALREHGELVRKYLGTALPYGEGKFEALNAAFWSGGAFLYVPANVRVEGTLRLYRWLSAAGTASFGRLLVVAGENAQLSLASEVASDDLAAQTLASSATEVFAEEGARVNFVRVQRWGRGVVNLATDRVVAGRDARVTTLNLALGADVVRADLRCALAKPGAHVDMLGLYLADGTQHFDHETLQDHIAPHASSNLLFKGALRERGRSVFRGLIRVHQGAQRTDAYQTNRNLILSSEARADSLPNLEIGADDVRCSHAATVGQLDEEEIFYLLSRGIPLAEATRLVVFGFFGEVLSQLPDELADVHRELTRAVEAKLFARR